jgi:hypothetical protein
VELGRADELDSSALSLGKSGTKLFGFISNLGIMKL